MPSGLRQSDSQHLLRPMTYTTKNLELLKADARKAAVILQHIPDRSRLETVVTEYDQKVDPSQRLAG